MMGLTAHYHVDRCRWLCAGQILGIVNPSNGANENTAVNRAIVCTYCRAFTGGTSEHGWRYLANMSPGMGRLAGTSRFWSS